MDIIDVAAWWAMGVLVPTMTAFLIVMSVKAWRQRDDCLPPVKHGLIIRALSRVASSRRGGSMRWPRHNTL